MAAALQRAPVGARSLQQVGDIGQHAGGGEREPVAQRLGHSCLSLQVFREVGQGVALRVALLVRDLFVAAGERDGLERDKADFVAVLQRELHDRADLLVVHGVDDRDHQADVDAGRVQVLDRAQLDVEQVGDLAVRVRPLRDAVKLQVRNAEARLARLLRELRFLREADAVGPRLDAEVADCPGIPYGVEEDRRNRRLAA